MAWDFINDFLRFWDTLISLFKREPKTLKDLGFKCQCSILVGDLIVTQDISDKVYPIGVDSNGKTLVTNLEPIVFPPLARGGIIKAVTALGTDPYGNPISFRIPVENIDKEYN